LLHCCYTAVTLLLQAATELGIRKPIIIRLEGTKVEEALKLIDDSGMRMLTASDLGEAASKAVRVVDILKMAEKAKLDISFELPM
jgi:succinyl-CoA synthetase beta subunit